MEKTGVREVSRQAYNQLIASGEAKNQKEIVFLRLLSFGKRVTRNELSQLAGFPINIITGRVKELIDGGVVMEDGKRLCNITGKPAHILTVCTNICVECKKPYGADVPDTCRDSGTCSVGCYTRWVMSPKKTLKMCSQCHNSFDGKGLFCSDLCTSMAVRGE